MAAEVADGVIAALGFAPEDIDGVHTTVAEGLAASGRKAEDFEVWWTADITFAQSVEEAAAQSLGWATNWLTISSLGRVRDPQEEPAQDRRPRRREGRPHPHPLRFALSGRRPVPPAGRAPGRRGPLIAGAPCPENPSPFNPRPRHRQPQIPAPQGAEHKATRT